MNHRQGTKLAKEKGYGLVEKMTGNELPLFLRAMVKKRMNKIETRRHGERRGKRGEEMEGIIDCLYPQNSALSSACSPSLCFVEVSRHIPEASSAYSDILREQFCETAETDLKKKIPRPHAGSLGIGFRFSKKLDYGYCAGPVTCRRMKRLRPVPLGTVALTVSSVPSVEVICSVTVSALQLPTSRVSLQRT